MPAAKESAAKKASTFKVGWHVAVVVKPDTAPGRCYVGQVQAIDSRGIRLSQLDWLTGRADGLDVYVPHRSIQSALIATDRDDPREFHDRARQWSERMCSPDKGKDGSALANG